MSTTAFTKMQDETTHQQEPQEPQDEEEDAPEQVIPDTAPLCRNCHKRRARENCGCCVACCENASCLMHMKAKEQKLWKEQILAGTTDIQLQAAQLRARRIQAGTFREPQFLYVGDSIVVWNLRDYMKNPKWKDEAVRKSKRRLAGAVVKKQRRRRSLDVIVDELYEKLLQQQSTLK